MTGRLCVPVDAYMLLERDDRVLMLRRAAGAGYAAGLLCPPSGHVEAGETVSDAAIRETAEETGVRLEPDQVRCVTVVRPAEEGAVILGGVDPGQLLPERALPECQFLVMQIGWRVNDDLQHTAVVRHGGHGVTTKIIEAAPDGDLRRSSSVNITSGAIASCGAGSVAQ